MSKPVDYAALTEKRCSKCRETKSVTEFNKYNDASAVLTGWRFYSHCRSCSNAASRAYGVSNKERRNARLRRWRRENPDAAKAKDKAAQIARYGLTKGTDEAAFARFDGMCWLCRVRPAKARDHDHTTGRFRGCLCHGCNSVTVARADADGDYLKRVADYIDRPCHADLLLELANS